MYDELVKRLRGEAAFAYFGEGEDGKKLRRLMEEAAFTIEVLSKQNEKWEEIMRRVIDDLQSMGVP